MKNAIRFTLLLAIAATAFGQLTTTSTTLSSAVTNGVNSGTSVWCLASATGVQLASPTQAASILIADTEAVRVQSAGPTSTCFNVRRGQFGTANGTHNSGATVWVGQVATSTGDPSRPFSGGPFTPGISTGPCTPSSQYTLPMISTGAAFVGNAGVVYTCPSTGPGANMWTITYRPSENYQFTDEIQFVPFTACETVVSGNSTGTQGFTMVGASNLGVVQAQTSATGTNTHTYTCHLPIPSRLTAAKGTAVSDVTFLYGVQTTALGTQATVLASGTFNGTIVFGKITMPTAAASETASTVAPARADTGTMVITPVAASFNTATTTAGAFYSAKFAPATPINITVDLVDFTFTVVLQCAATSATITNSPGLYVHLVSVPL